VQYDKAPQVTRERMYIDMMQQILSSTTKVLVDQKNGNSLLYLPFDKLIQSTNPGATPLPELQSAAKPAESAAAPESEAGALRSRDTALTRERGARP
jgi:membrane protease subunit HflK